MSNKKTKIEELLEIMSMLRDKQFGCPWDLKQNFASIAPHTLEEVYEVIDCVEQGDIEHLSEELGDLLFQVVFYAQMAKEDELFSFDDVCEAIISKLLTRHPHVFPDATISSFGQESKISPQQVEVNWESIKKGEREQGAQTSVSLLDDVPQALPALLRARKLQARAAIGGFEWDEITGVIDKLKEEVEELEEAIELSNNLADKQAVEEEFGDVLFSMVNLARFLKINPESSLRAANIKFTKRFQAVEAKLSQQNEEMKDLSLDQLEEYWQEVKKELSSN